MSKNKEDDAVVMPPALDAFKTILEEAEIDYEEDLRDGSSPVLYLGNGIIATFGADSELVSLDVE